MAVAQMRVPTIFTAVDRFSDVVSRMTNKTAHFSKSTVGAINRVDHKLNNMWGSMNNISQLAIGGGVGGLFYYAGKDIMDYETAIHSLGAVTGTVVGSMNKDIESLGKETGRSVIDITKGFEDIGSKMSEYLKNPTALKEIARQGILMANASRMSAEDSIDNLTSLLNQFGKGYGDANAIVNKLSAGEDIGASTIPETIDILRQFAASARMAGADYTESIAMVQAVTKTLGKQGVGRNFRNIMVDLNTGKGMDKNKLKALAMVGINIDKMIDPATTFIDKMKELTKLSGNKQAMGMFFKKTGMEAGSTFLREFKTFENYLAFIQKNNTAQAKAEKNTSTLSFAIDQLKNSFTNFVVTNNDANGALGMTKSLIRWMTDNMGGIISLIEKVLYAFLAWKAIVGINLLVTKSILGVKWAVLMVTKAMKLYNIALLASAVSGDTFLASLLGISSASASVVAMSIGIVGAIALIGASMYIGTQTTKRFADANNTTFKLVTKQTVGSLQEIMAKMDAAIAKIKELKTAQDSLVTNPLTEKSMKEVLSYDKKKLFEENVAKGRNDLLIKAPRVNVGNAFTNITDANSGQPVKNLAGSNDANVTNLKEFIASKAGQMKLIVSYDRGFDVKTEGDTPKGIDVVLQGNQGTRGKGN